MKKLNACLIIILSIVVFVQAQSKTEQTDYPTFVGTPETDTTFAPFISKNLGHTVYLKLKIENGYGVTIGYKDNSPYFDSKKTKGINYTYFIENCETTVDENDNYSHACKEMKWDYEEYESENGENFRGTLSGYFKVSRIIRTSMRNYRAVFLIPMKVSTKVRTK